MAKVLVADDDRDVLEAVRQLLKGAGYTVVPVTSPAAAEAAVQKEEPDVALLDMNYARDTTSGREGRDLITRLRQSAPDLPIVVMTAWSSVAGAVEAMQCGAQDYVEKPWSNERLLTILNQQLAMRAERRQAARREAQTVREQSRALPELIAISRPMQQILKLMERIATYDANVLITGEHGTGKDLVARWIHAASKRASKAFVPVNAGALPEGLFESELFGHVKGAFTDAACDRIGCFELADGGSLFLDEIGTMPVTQQAKLLRILQTGEFQAVGSARARRCDVRVLSATNVDVAKSVADGVFREDLLYRLNTVEVHLPPLRDRPEDIPALARHYLEQAKRRYARPTLEFGGDVVSVLSKHAWPGNVRELAHVIERAVLFAETEVVTASQLSFGARFARSRSARAHDALRGGSLSGAPGHRANRQRSGGGAVVGPVAKRALSTPAGARHQSRGMNCEPATLVLGAALVVLSALWLRSRTIVARRLRTMAAVLAAFRDGDYSIRARTSNKRGELFDEVLKELNELGSSLREQRLDKIEAWTLLRNMLAELDVVVFAFDEQGRVRFCNPAAANALQTTPAALPGGEAELLGLTELLRGSTPRVVQDCTALAGSWHLRRSSFRLLGEPHALLVLAPLSDLLREQEREAWKRLVRVLGHEINNSLAAIQSIAENSTQTLRRSPLPPGWEQDLAAGLSIVHRRALALAGFTAAYTRLSRLPAPQLETLDLAECVRRAVECEPRLAVEVRGGPTLCILADRDQIEQLLINLLKNAVDAALSHDGGVRVWWSSTARRVELTIEDDGPGPPDTANLFVPFFTTKPGGSGIGLALARQIAETHGGSVALQRRADRPGAQAIVHWPLQRSAPSP